MPTRPHPRRLDPVGIAQELLRCRSITPSDDGCIGRAHGLLSSMGWAAHAFTAGSGRAQVANLIASYGQGGPVFAFAGHTDVVPPGDEGAWRHGPFSGAVAEGFLWGRGAADMKGAVAAFIAAAHRYIAAGGPRHGTIMVLLTGDEEVGGPHGMRAVIDRLAARGQRPDACLIGEPSCEGYFGQGIRIGRRGSLNVEVVAEGAAGHVAWPDRARNALHLLMDFLQAARGEDLGPAIACFPASHLEVTQVAADGAFANVIPGRASARLNVRFNTRHSGAALVARLSGIARALGPGLTLAPAISGEPYLAGDGPLPRILAEQVERALGRRPQMNAGGGVSDGRFLRQLCPVVEFGLVGDLAHQLDERVRVEDIIALRDVYAASLGAFFAAP